MNYGNEKPVETYENGITVYRYNIKKKRSGFLQYIWQYSSFILLSAYKLTNLHFKKRYDVVLIHNMPEVLVFSAGIAKLFGAKILLDLRDPMPELLTSIFAKPPDHWMTKFLIFLEKISVKFSDLVITPNIAFRNLFIERSCKSSKIHIIMNSPDEYILKEEYLNLERTVDKDRYLVMYHGTVVQRHGLDIAVKAIDLLREKIPNIKFYVYGAGDYIESIKQMVLELKLENHVEIKGLVLLDELAKIIATVDLGIIPNRLNVFTRINFPVRIFEYLIMKKPVIVPRTPGILDYYDDSSIYFFNNDNPSELADKIYRVYSNKEEREQIINMGYEIFEKYRWRIQQERMVNLTKALAGQYDKNFLNADLYEQ
jgi:glycosyltransferase involved in cell wall biosynthesis